MAYKGWSGGEKINWKAIDASAPKPLAIGVYKAKVVKAEPKETSKGDPGASLQFKVTERYGDDEDLNRKTFDNLTFTQDGAFRAKMIAEALEIDPPDTSSFEDVEDFCERLEGEEVWVYLVHNTYQGKTNNRIMEYIHADGLEDYVEKLESGDDEDEKPKRKSKASGKSANGKSANGRRASAKGDSDDLNEDDEDDKPKRGSKAKGDDEEPEERPTRRRAAAAEEEEERPRRRRREAAPN